MSHRYVSSCESKVDRQGEFQGLEDPIRISKNTAIVYNCYDAPNGSTAKARFDSGPWMSMKQCDEKGGYVRMKMPHHFSLSTDAAKLTTGKHRVTARVTWPDGTILTESADLAVTN